MPSQKAAIPILIPSQFDDYIFSNWKPSISGFYEKFHIERIENYKQHLNLPLLPHRRSVYFFIYLSKGKAIRSKGLTNYEIHENQFFCLPMHQITSLTYVREDTEGFYCHFLPEIFNQQLIRTDIAKDFPFFHLTAEPLLQIKKNENILALLSILEREYRTNDEKRFDLIPLYLLSLFSELNHAEELQTPFQPNSATLLTQRYKNALAAFIYEKKTVQEFADYLAVSPNHLNKCTREVIGKSAHTLLEDMRLLEAQVLLKQTNLSIAEIAFKIGKFDPSDFSRFFKNMVKVTPNQYRKMNS